jgi:hypothetical protein
MWLASSRECAGFQRTIGGSRFAAEVIMHRSALLLTLVLPGLAGSEALAAPSEGELARGLRGALAQGVDRAVGQLGRENGYLSDPRVHIPLPDSLARVDATLRRFGSARRTDELITAMNRAAEAAVPEARAFLLEALRQMTIQDAREILAGGDTAATAYFRRQTEAAIAARFAPVVRRATEKVRLAETYNQFAGRALKYRLIRPEDADLNAYITRKALDGLFLTIAEEERTIRRHPGRQQEPLLREVFGALASGHR